MTIISSTSIFSFGTFVGDELNSDNVTVFRGVGTGVGLICGDVGGLMLEIFAWLLATDGRRISLDVFKRLTLTRLLSLCIHVVLCISSPSRSTIKSFPESKCGTWNLSSAAANTISRLNA